MNAGQPDLHCLRLPISGFGMEEHLEWTQYHLLYLVRVLPSPWLLQQAQHGVLKGPECLLILLRQA
eukprot:1150973-Pelagomonas_calceolata.AAC.6